ncbi:MAG: mevalonate kinase [Patiriisocius sp.]|jgi:mevalonate kinase
MLKEALYNGKILLFGEYGIIQDSMGLSIPYDIYKGSLKFDKSNKEAKSSTESLIKFRNYLKNDIELSSILDVDQFSIDLDSGMFFDSSIPQGYGVGSSGAIVAAIYDGYAIDKIKADENPNNQNLITLKRVFGLMESFFHGKSSGLDPLICYLNLPILIRSKEEMRTVGLPQENNGKGAIFLLNTGIKGKTQPLVTHFMERCKEEGFRKMLKSEFKKYNDAAIESFLNKDFSPLLSNVKQLSRVVLDHFKPMIPKVFQKLWKEGLDSNLYYLKLCGSGGGGFILGFTEDFEKAQDHLKDYELSKIYMF